MTTPNSPEPNLRKVALVTGASRGIGRAIAIELARVDYDVMITYATNSQAADEAAAAIRAANEAARVSICRSDIAAAGDREELIQKRARNLAVSISSSTTPASLPTSESICWMLPSKALIG